MSAQEDRLFKNRYYYGKLLTEEGFRLEQQWAQQHQRLQGRWALGAGVLEGLTVERAYDDCVAVSPGAAVDGLGRLLILSAPVTCILREMEGFDAQAASLHIALRYEEAPAHPRFCAPGAQDGTTECDCVEERASVILCAEAAAELVILGSAEPGKAGGAARVTCSPQKPEPPAAKRMTADMLRRFAEEQLITPEEIQRFFKRESAALEERLGSELERRISATRAELEERSRALIEESTGRVREGLLDELRQETETALERFRLSFTAETAKRLTAFEERLRQETRAQAAQYLQNELEPAVEAYFSRAIETGFFEKYFKNAVYDLTLNTVRAQHAKNSAWGYLDVQVEGTNVHYSHKVVHHLGRTPLLIDVALCGIDRERERFRPDYMPNEIVNHNFPLFNNVMLPYLQHMGDIQISVLQNTKDESFTLAVRTENPLPRHMALTFVWFALRCAQSEPIQAGMENAEADA